VATILALLMGWRVAFLLVAVNETGCRTGYRNWVRELGAETRS
jgi:predicted MFS family arabinose efflux permease